MVLDKQDRMARSILILQASRALLLDQEVFTANALFVDVGQIVTECAELETVLNQTSTRVLMHRCQQHAFVLTRHPVYRPDARMPVSHG